MRFEVGKKYTSIDDHNNRFNMEVIDRTEDTVTFEWYAWNSKVTQKFDIEIDDGRNYGCEYVETGRVNGIRCFVYA